MGLCSFCTGTTSQLILLFELYHRMQPLTIGILKFNIPFIFDPARVGPMPYAVYLTLLFVGAAVLSGPRT